MGHVAGWNYHQDCVLYQFSLRGTLSYTRNILEFEMSQKKEQIFNGRQLRI